MRTLPALLAAALPAWGAIGYSSFRHPKGDFVLEYPSDWKRSVGVQTVTLRPAGRGGQSARVSLERMPLTREDPAAPEAYLRALERSAEGLKRVAAGGTVTVAGRKAERRELIETKELFGKHGEALPGPLREAVVVVPLSERHYYVLRLQGVGADYDKALPEFDRLVSRLVLAPPGQP